MGAGLQLGCELARAALDHGDACPRRPAEKLGGGRQPNEGTADLAAALLESARLGAHPPRRLRARSRPLGPGTQPARVAAKPVRPLAQARLLGGHTGSGVGELAPAQLERRVAMIGGRGGLAPLRGGRLQPVGLAGQLDAPFRLAGQIALGGLAGALGPGQLVGQAVAPGGGRPRGLGRARLAGAHCGEG